MRSECYVGFSLKYLKIHLRINVLHEDTLQGKIEYIERRSGIVLLQNKLHSRIKKLFMQKE